MDLASTVFGFLAGLLATLLTALFTGYAKEMRRRISLLRIVEWQAVCLITACRNAEETEMWDNSRVESFARYLRETYLRKPELVLAAGRRRTRAALEQIYEEVCGILGLLELYRDQVKHARMPRAIARGTYAGLANRCEQSLGILKRARWWIYLGGH